MDSQLLEGDWAALRTAVIAGRISCFPQVAHIPIQTWAAVLKYFATMLRRPGPEMERLFQSVNAYQAQLDAYGLTDLDIRAIDPQVTSPRAIKPGSGQLLCGILVQLIISFLLFILAIPGSILWSPIWLLCIVKERGIIKQGKFENDSGFTERHRRNFDTISEKKQLIGFIGLTSICMLIGVIAILLGREAVGRTICGPGDVGYCTGVSASLVGLFTAAVLVPLLLWVTMRVLETAMAVLRAILSKWSLLRIGEQELRLLARERQSIADALPTRLAELAPVGALPTLPPKPMGVFWGRRKADWHESFALHDDLTFIGIHEDVKESKKANGDNSAGVRAHLIS